MRGSKLLERGLQKSSIVGLAKAHTCSSFLFGFTLNWAENIHAGPQHSIQNHGETRKHHNKSDFVAIVAHGARVEQKKNVYSRNWPENLSHAFLLLYF